MWWGAKQKETLGSTQIKNDFRENEFDYKSMSSIKHGV
jgi:hypothetical protein